jgi:hypothetical protein
VTGIYIMAAPVHQMQQYYRLGALDNCSEKWTALVDCLSLKTKRSTEVQVCFSNFIHLWIFLFFILFYCASLFRVLNQMLHGLIFTTMLLVACVSIHNVSR